MLPDRGEILRILVAPEFWLCLGSAGLLGGLFISAVVRRRDPSPMALLAVGLLFGLAGNFNAESPFSVHELRESLLFGCFFWFVLPLPIVIGAVIQPGEKAPMDLQRLARHLGPAMIGSILMLICSLDASWLAMPIVLVALCSGRRSDRVERAWHTASVVLSVHAAILIGYVLVEFLFKRSESETIVFEGWVAAQVLLAELERSHSLAITLRRALSVSLLTLLSALLSFADYLTESKILWYAGTHPLPQCRAYYGLPSDGWVGLPRDLSATASLPAPGEEEASAPLLVTSPEDLLETSLLQSPLHLACVTTYGHYGALPIIAGSGVELALTDEGRIVLADGNTPSEARVVEAARRCQIETQVSLGGERPWPSQLVAAQCDYPWRCVAGRLCTYSEPLGWHIEELVTPGRR